MLILTRKLTESITIGSDITVVVLGIKGNQVRIGIAAPQEVTVHREEIYDQTQALARYRRALNGDQSGALDHGAGRRTRKT